MTKEKEISVLLQIAKGDKKEGISLTGLNIPALISLAMRHKVMYQMLLFTQEHKSDFTEEQIRQLTELSRHNAQRSLVQLHELKSIAGVLNEKRIGYVCIKGPQLSRMIYGREALKESVDLDIMLVNGNDLTRVHELLTEMGYLRSNLNLYKGKFRRKAFLIAKREVHYFNKKNRCAIDLHIRPGANTYLTAANFRGFLSQLKTYDLDGTLVPVLQDEPYFVYLCYHGSLHQFSRLAWLMDIRAFLMLKGKELDYKKVYTIARSLNVERNVNLTLLLLDQYFGEIYVETQNLASLHNRRLQFLASYCRNMLGSDAKYGLSIKARIGKMIYIMMLIRGIAGKIDWFYGILMRQLIKILSNGSQSRKAA